MCTKLYNSWECGHFKEINPGPFALVCEPLSWSGGSGYCVNDTQNRWDVQVWKDEYQYDSEDCDACKAKECERKMDKEGGGKSGGSSVSVGA